MSWTLQTVSRETLFKPVFSLTICIKSCIKKMTSLFNPKSQNCRVLCLTLYHNSCTTCYYWKVHEHMHIELLLQENKTYLVGVGHVNKNVWLHSLVHELVVTLTVFQREWEQLENKRHSETCCCTNITTSVWRHGPTISVLQKVARKCEKSCAEKFYHLLILWNSVNRYWLPLQIWIKGLRTIRWE